MMFRRGHMPRAREERGVKEASTHVTRVDFPLSSSDPT